MRVRSEFCSAFKRHAMRQQLVLNVKKLRVFDICSKFKKYQWVNPTEYVRTKETARWLLKVLNKMSHLRPKSTKDVLVLTEK